MAFSFAIGIEAERRGFYNADAFHMWCIQRLAALISFLKVDFGRIFSLFLYFLMEKSILHRDEEISDMLEDLGEIIKQCDHGHTKKYPQGAANV